MPPYTPTLSSDTPSVAHAHGNGRGGGFFTYRSASPSWRFTSTRLGSSASASLSLASAAAYRPPSSSSTPACHTGLNLLSPGRTSVPCKNVRTSRAGIRKLKPCRTTPSGESDTKSMTPTTTASSPMAGPPLLPCAAGASVCIRSWPIASILKPETVPLVTEASTLADWFSSSWESTTPGKPRMCTGSPIWESRVASPMAG